MKTTAGLISIFLLFSLLYAGEYPRYIEYSFKKYTPIRETDDEIAHYFSEIKRIQDEDISAAVKNYQKFINKYYASKCVQSDSKDINIPVFREVFSIIMHNELLLSEYRKLYESTAQESFMHASRVQDIKEMEKIVQFYFPTVHGLRAAFFLATYYLDHGDLDRALYYTDILQRSPFAGKASEKIISAIVSLKEFSGSGNGKFSLESINTVQPEWIGGVSISTVYPGEIDSFLDTALVYPLVFSRDYVYVNTGSNVYAYHVSSGKHGWLPDTYHTVQTSSIFKPEGIITLDQAAIEDIRKEGVPRHEQFIYENRFYVRYERDFPVGRIYHHNKTVTAALNKPEHDNVIVIFDAENGAVLEKISGEYMRSLLNKRGEDVSRGNPYLSFAPCLSGEHLFLALYMVLEDSEERCFLIDYNISTRNVEWSRNLYNVRIKPFADVQKPMECVVMLAGSYVIVFSFTGYIGVSASFDGSLVWDRLLLPEAISEWQKHEMIKVSYFIPVITERDIIIEGEYKKELTCLSIKTGKIKWKISAGEPLWGIPVRTGIIAALHKGDNTVLIKLDHASGTVEWEFNGVSRFPGYVHDDTVICSTSTHVLAIDVESGKLIKKVKLERCGLPGRVYIHDSRLYIVNSSGVYVYGPE